MLPRREPGRAEFIGLIAALMGLNSLAIDVILPAFPAIAHALQVTNPNQVQLTVGAYIFGFGITSLVAGPLADTYGRRRPLLVGIGLFVLAALVQPLSPNLVVLLVLRVVQGIGGGVIRVSQAVVRDRYVGADMAAIMSLSMMAFLILPVIAPAIGQVVMLSFGWQAIFLAMAVLAGLIGIWVWWRLPETLPPKARRPFTFASVGEAMMIVLRQRDSLGYGTAAMFLLGALFGYINCAQQIFVGTFGAGVMFPVYFAICALAQSAAAFANARLVRRIGLRRIGYWALIFYTVFAAAMTTCGYLGWNSLPVFLILITATMCMFSCADSNLAALAMEPLGTVAGTASSTFGAVQTVGATLIGIIIGQSYDGTTRPIAMGYLVMGLLSLLAISLGSGGDLGKSTETRIPQ